jgi:hypothetical protein
VRVAQTPQLNLLEIVPFKRHRCKRAKILRAIKQVMNVRSKNYTYAWFTFMDVALVADVKAKEVECYFKWLRANGYMQRNSKQPELWRFVRAVTL